MVDDVEDLTNYTDEQRKRGPILESGDMPSTEA
jgi:hypothetical protein